MILQFWKSPSFWTGIVAILAYCDRRALNGGYVYDDAGSVIKNVVVNGMVDDWKEAFKRDYWGTLMTEPQSHKSFRPITTLTLKANYVWAQQDMTGSPDGKHPPTFTFHLVNVALHGAVTSLVTSATKYILPDIVSQLVVGCLFALHPVHAEVVSNITSRGEMLMSLFFLMAFISFAATLTETKRRNNMIRRFSSPAASDNTTGATANSAVISPIKPVSWIRRLGGIYILPWICMTLSLFSKEQGATTLISLVLFDFLTYHGNVASLWKDLTTKLTTTATATTSTSTTETAGTTQLHQLRYKRTDAWSFVIRTIILAIQTLIVVAWRYYLNGESSPDFIEEQNPAGFAKDRFTRAFSVSWVYCLYIRDALWPYYLCPDWSGLSIDLVTNIKDPRAVLVLTLWYFTAQSLWTMIVGVKFPERILSSRNNESQPLSKAERIERRKAKARQLWWNETTLNQINMSIWAFTFAPFLLSSNILVVVGLMKADRVIYLPLFGFCLLEALLLGKFLKGAKAMRPSFETRRLQEFWGANWFLMFQLIVFAGRTHDRNIAWSDSLRLWGSAYAINPRSHHTMYNYGYELSIKQQYREAEMVMRPIGDPRVEGPSNTFVYAMVLFNLQQCHRANELLDDAFRVIEEKRKIGGPRNSDSHLSRTESNLLVAKAHCTEAMQERGRVLYQAVETDPTNEYAVGLATEFMKKLEKYESLQSEIYAMGGMN
mmetsp:Transcript_32315/g.78876  ORF Transcript_32315/g.78876 Transcript_32315/m.78876 type:complete len:716 (+) Transcript_32315:72-2219(+)